MNIKPPIIVTLQALLFSYSFNSVQDKILTGDYVLGWCKVWYTRFLLQEIVTTSKVLSASHPGTCSYSPLYITRRYAWKNKRHQALPFIFCDTKVSIVKSIYVFL